MRCRMQRGLAHAQVDLGVATQMPKIALDQRLPSGPNGVFECPARAAHPGLRVAHQPRDSEALFLERLAHSFPAVVLLHRRRTGSSTPVATE